MFKNQPKGLFALALANTGERFGYYTMLAVFVLFLKENFGLTEDQAGDIYATFLACVYFLPFIGGILADKFGYGKMVTMGIVTMFAGYVLLAWPLGTGDPGLYAMYGALALISIGTGLFKGNLQVMVGNLYDDPKYASKLKAAEDKYVDTYNSLEPPKDSKNKDILNVIPRITKVEAPINEQSGPVFENTSNRQPLGSIQLEEEISVPTEPQKENDEKVLSGNILTQ
jgi:hypothetical protein